MDGGFRMIGLLVSGCVSLLFVKYHSWTLGLTALSVPLTALWLTSDGSAANQEEEDEEPNLKEDAEAAAAAAAAAEEQQLLPEIECSEWVEPGSEIKLGPLSTPLALDNRSAATPH